MKTGPSPTQKKGRKYGFTGVIVLCLAILVGMPPVPRRVSGQERTETENRRPVEGKAHGIPKTALEFSRRVQEIKGFPDKGIPITLRHLAYHRSGIRHYCGKVILAFVSNMGNAPIRGVPRKRLGTPLGEEGA